MTLSGLGNIRLGLQLVALGCVLTSAQQLVQHDDGSGVVRILFQHSASDPNIHYSADGKDWTGTTGVPMTRSLLEGEYSAANGWYQHEVPASQVKFVFNSEGKWHRSLWGEAYEVTSPGTYVVDSKEVASTVATTDAGYVNTTGYKVTKVQKGNGRFALELALNDGNVDATYGASIKELTVDVSQSGENAVRVKIADKNAKRWEVPRDLYTKGDLGKAGTAQWGGSFTGSGSNLDFSYTEKPFTFKVTRKSDGYVLFDTSKLSLVLKDQYLQISTAVKSDLSIFGLGESTRDSLKINPGDKHTLWARDQFSNERINNVYGSHPFYLGLNDKGKAHGVLLLNSNGMDVTLEKDQLVYQTIGGILDFYFVAGPTPVDVVAQYTSLIGRPKLQPYWAYGFHQCRWGYESVKALRDVVDNYASAKIPLDVIWADIDFMNKFYDFTTNPVNFSLPDLQKFVGDVHTRGQKIVPIVDPGIPDDTTDYAYSRGLEYDVFIKDTKGTPYLGQVWPGPTVFPDFFHPNATTYWSEQLTKFHKDFGYDGIWLDMNELANFCPGNSCARKPNTTCPLTGSVANIVTCCLECVDDMNKWDHPPFDINNVQVKDPLFKKGISTSALQYGSIRQYDAHNLYGFTEGIATTNAQENLLQKLAFTLSRSTFPGSGAYVAHWTGDNGATWDDLRWSIPTILNFGLFGIPMVGSDICGYVGDTTEELCARWTALGSFYPFSRNHNNFGQISQETYRWESVAAVGRKFIGLRYRLLPYLYTLGYEAHVSGTPIARALFWEFPQDVNARTAPALDRQFLLGDAILVTPVLTQGATSVTGYLPAGTWYDIFNYTRVVSKGESKTWDVKLEDMPVHVRGGSILALHQPSLTSTAARESPFDLLVALSADNKAAGQLYLDSGDDLNSADHSTIIAFRVDSLPLLGTTLTSHVTKAAYKDASSKKFAKITILGVAKQPTIVLANILTAVKTSTYDAAKQTLELDLTSLNLKITELTTLFWF
ncbi:hypothetical protein Poli38472_005267 [Pythium oligandrum]|uniref:Maltase n=1 Tax=Pythium oligandrum TaxID=41045 RepID=A0A8K1CFQ5_PYTOL|nr:hypothetical protein Poli38472_005267 [Pythium oligandrum]|eukprot:TMW62649.1 hypothetical protein Poli38472_005267 [Pythium oligandrum]